jgi:hypothetical protein
MKMIRASKWLDDRDACAMAIRTIGFLILCAALTEFTRAQSVFSGQRGGLAISAGATGSGEYVQYGERKMVAVTGFVDADTRRHWGVEAEGRWIEFRQSANVHIETYSIGGRYHFAFPRFQPYVKGLAGFGNYNFPYNLATGRFLVATAGAGLDIRVGRGVYIRAADAEYQYWPQFTFGAMSTGSISAGLRVRIF